jgi:hypothetical protein
VDLTVDEAVARTFFNAYFSMFGVPARDLGPAIQKALFPCLNRGRVCMQGTAHLVIVGWHPPASRTWKTDPC